ncbi:MAG: hypothetical protein LBN24_11595 [Mediterranea sp.]|jgi:hypothetical protein|nr:hypothetical protein [Mediterranea sp.]
MESQRPKITLYAKRSFGEKLNTSFDFIKENWKPILKYITYLMLPLCMIQSLFMNGMNSAMTSFVGGDLAAANIGKASHTPPILNGPFLLNYLGTIFFGIIAGLMAYSLLYSLMKLYNDREERLKGITFNDIRPLLFKNMGRLFVLGIVYSILFTVVIFIMMLLGYLTLWTLVLTIPLLVALMIPLFLAAPVYLFEDISLFDSIVKTYRIGFPTWGGTFLIVLVMGIIASVLQGIAAMPWYIVYVVKLLFSYSDGAASPSIWINFIQYLFGILMLYGGYITMILTVAGTVFQYGHACEVTEGVTVVSDIENFDNL